MMGALLGCNHEKDVVPSSGLWLARSFACLKDVYGAVRGWFLETVCQGRRLWVYSHTNGGKMEGSELYLKKAKPSSSVPRNYPDLRDHLAALDDKGLLRRVDRPINKDT